MPESTMYIIWAAAILLFGIAEGVTVQLVSIWFLIGAVVALIAAFCGASIPVQVVIFVAVTIVTLIATRPIVKKKLNPKRVKTNADRCIGQEGIVIEEINNLLPTGQVKVDGKVWTARSESPETVIPKGSLVLIEKIDGVKLIVKTLPKQGEKV